MARNSCMANVPSLRAMSGNVIVEAQNVVDAGMKGWEVPCCHGFLVGRPFCPMKIGRRAHRQIHMVPSREAPALDAPMTAAGRIRGVADLKRLTKRRTAARRIDAGGTLKKMRILLDEGQQEALGDVSGQSARRIGAGPIIVGRPPDLVRSRP